MSMEDKKFIESIITDKWYRLQYAAERGENLAYLRGSFTGFCQMARLAMIVTDADIERCQQEAMVRFENEGRSKKMTVEEMEKAYGVRLTPADTFVTSTGDDDLGYTTEYRLNEVVPDDKVSCVMSAEGYWQETYDDSDVAGYVISETHCGHGRGCFWTEDEVCQWDATLADWEKLKKS